MEDQTTSVDQGRERRVVYYYCDDDEYASCANYICRCKCFLEAFRALLKCLGLDSETISPTPDHMCTTTTPPPPVHDHDHDHHKDQEDHQAAAGIDVPDDDKPATCHDPAFGSSSSSGEEQTMADPPSTAELPTSSDPTASSTDDPTSDPALLALGNRRAPPRPPVTSGRGAACGFL